MTILHRKLGSLWREWLRSVLLTVLAITAFRSAVADWNDVPTGSMRPTILEGDRIVVNKLAYDLRLPFTSWRVASFREPRRGDIVVLRSPDDRQRLVKRVIGLPGDTIAMRNNHLVVNGDDLRYEPLDPAVIAGLGSKLGGLILATEKLGVAPHPVLITPGSAARSSFPDLLVPDGAFFVMGDNRDQSLDSRYFGFVPRSEIVGRATAIAASVDPENSYLPRWQRFFCDLE